jgi:hypothetical protein
LILPLMKQDPIRLPFFCRFRYRLINSLKIFFDHISFLLAFQSSLFILLLREFEIKCTFYHLFSCTFVESETNALKNAFFIFFVLAFILTHLLLKN